MSYRLQVQHPSVRSLPQVYFITAKYSALKSKANKILFIHDNFELMKNTFLTSLKWMCKLIYDISMQFNTFKKIFNL